MRRRAATLESLSLSIGQNHPSGGLKVAPFPADVFDRVAAEHAKLATPGRLGLAVRLGRG